MRPIIEWCVDCYSSGNQVLATENVNGDALCKPCALLVTDEPAEEAVVAKSTKALEEKQREMRERNSVASLASTSAEQSEHFKSVIGTDKVATLTVTETETQTKIVKQEKKAEITVSPKPDVEHRPDRQADHQLSITLESGGILTLLFDCGNFFELSKQDRDFVYSIIDRMNNYSSPDKMNIERSGKDGERLYPVMMPVSVLEDVFRNCADEADAAALYAAWYRGDPAIRPIQGGGK